MLQNGLVRQIYKSGDGTGDLVAANNFSDLESGGGDLETSRTNLGVYSQDETDARLNALAPARRMAFDGVSGRLTIADADFPTQYETGSFAIVWAGVVPAANGGNAVIVDKKNFAGTASSGFLFRKSTADKAVFTVSDGTNQVDLVETDSGAGAFHVFFCVVDRENDEVRVYKDGVLQGSAIDISTLGDIASPTNFQLANNSGSGFSKCQSSYFAFFNYALPATDDGAIWGIDTRYKLAQPVMPEERDTPESETATSGTLTVDRVYRINSFETGDDFTNVGASSNATGETFVATGTTPTDWSNGSELQEVGAILDLRHIPGLEGSLQVDFGNGIRGTLSTSGVTLPNDETEGKITVEVANATGSATNTNLLGGSAQPLNTAISKVAYRRTAGSGAFSLGTTSGGTEIINAESGSGDLIDASALVSRNLVTAADDLFVNMAANTTYEITIYFTRIN